MNQKTNENTTTKFEFSVIEGPTRIIPDIIEKKLSGKEYVNYGEDNKLPEYLWNLYLKSAILQSIINGTVDFASGNGAILSEFIMKFENNANKEGETLEEIVRKIFVDYNIYGGFAMNVIYDMEGKVAEIYWLDVQNVRLNEDGDKAWYSEKWGQWGAKAIEYPVWKPGKTYKSCIFYFKGHLSRGVYPIPRYVGALADVETSTEIGKFHLNNILNNLEPSAIISFNNGVPSKSEQKEIEKKIHEKLAGANNAGRFMVAFNDNKDNAVSIERLTEDHMDEKFQTLQKSTRENIFIANRATPALFGLNPENNGFSKEEFLEAFELYNKTVVIPMQKDVQRCFDKIFGIDGSILFNKFQLEDTVENKPAE